jgi:hypothetical protein
MNYLEIFNELIILIISANTVAYSDFLLDQEFKYELGWNTVFLFFLCLCVNIVLIVLVSLFKVIQKAWNLIKFKKGIGKYKAKITPKKVGTNTNLKPIN